MEGTQNDDNSEETKHSDILSSQKQESPSSNIKNA
jgi:hypothetical protein